MKATGSSLEDPDAYDDDDDDDDEDGEGAEEDGEDPPENSENPVDIPSPPSSSNTTVAPAPTHPNQQSAESPAVSTLESASAVLRDEIGKADAEGGLGIWWSKAWE